MDEPGEHELSFSIEAWVDGPSTTVRMSLPDDVPLADAWDVLEAAWDRAERRADGDPEDETVHCETATKQQVMRLEVTLAHMGQEISGLRESLEQGGVRDLTKQLAALEVNVAQMAAEVKQLARKEDQSFSVKADEKPAPTERSESLLGNTSFGGDLSGWTEPWTFGR